MIDSLRTFTLSAYMTLFAATPDLDFLQFPYEKVGFGVLLFFIIWSYMKNVLPKTQQVLEEKNKRIEELIREISRLVDQRYEDQKTISDLVRNQKEKENKHENLDDH
jgi:F0F1-type ATP synthase membrane subunit b/b'